MRIHVTGGRGFLGAYIRRALESDHELEVSDVDDLDVTDLDATVAGLAGEVDAVCHLAGLTGAQASVRSPERYFRVNATGTLNVLEACRRNRIRRLVFLSTLTVHGASDAPVAEDSPMVPRHPYAASKAAAEMMLATYARSFGIASATLRATLIAGEGQAEANAVSDFVRIARRNGTIEIYGPGTHSREWLHPEDLARAVARAIDRLATADHGAERFIISSGRPISMRDLARTVVRRVGSGGVDHVDSTSQAFSLTTDTTKARRLLGWRPGIGIEEIIDRVAAAID